MNALAQAHTSVVIAHRLSTKDADQIIVLKHGQIAEQALTQSFWVLEGSITNYKPGQHEDW